MNISVQINDNASCQLFIEPDQSSMLIVHD